MSCNLLITRGNYFPDFILEIKTESVACKIQFFNLDSNQKDDWNIFVDAVDGNDECIFALNTGNGFTGIRTKNGMTTFELSKYGRNGDGEITIEIPNDICMPAFKKVSA